jgi:hypothetical protein
MYAALVAPDMFIPLELDAFMLMLLELVPPMPIELDELIPILAELAGPMLAARIHTSLI